MSTVGRRPSYKFTETLTQEIRQSVKEQDTQCPPLVSTCMCSRVYIHTLAHTHTVHIFHIHTYYAHTHTQACMLAKTSYSFSRKCGLNLNNPFPKFIVFEHQTFIVTNIYQNSLNVCITNSTLGNDLVKSFLLGPAHPLCIVMSVTSLRDCSLGTCPWDKCGSILFLSCGTNSL